MKNNFIHRIISFSMALVILCSTTGMAMDAHYCQKVLKSISLLGSAPSCHETMDQPIMTEECSQHPATVKISSEPCCQNQLILIDGLDTEVGAVSNFVLQDVNFLFVYSFLHTYSNLPLLATSFTHHYNYPSPLPDLDFQVLFQSFLI